MPLTKTTEKTDLGTVPAVFAAAFARLARRVSLPGGRLDPGTARDYWTALEDLPLKSLVAAAETLARERVFFPAVAEWRQAAARHRPRHDADCDQCGGAGLIKICYRSGEPFDVAICACAPGQWYRQAGVGFVRQRLRLTSAQQVGDLEDVEGEL